jgi:hypothetical protein
MWAAALMIPVIFILAIMVDKASKSAAAGCCGKFCHCCNSFNEFKLEAYFVIFASFIFTILAIVAFGDSCVIFGVNKYGVQGNVFSQQFTFTTPVLRKFAGFPDPCSKLHFCSMYLTLPNMPYKTSEAVVVNFLSVFTGNQEKYEGLIKDLQNPKLNYKQRIEIQDRIENLHGDFIEMKVYWGKFEDYQKSKRLDNSIHLPSKTSQNLWYRRIGNSSTKYQIHSLL